MSVVKCGRCKKFLPKEEARRNGVQSFHPDCLATTFKKDAKKPKKKNISDTLRIHIQELDGHRCRFCGKPKRLQVHHVIYRSEQGPHEQSNLLSLCQECHDTVHSNKKKWQKVCLGVIWLRSMGDKQITVPQLERKLNEDARRRD